MNGEHVISWLIEDADRNAEECYPDIWEYKLEDHLYELNSRRDIDLPSGISPNSPPSENKAISILKETFKNKISLITLVLNYLYPEKYIFYRVSALENEIFSGFKFLRNMLNRLWRTCSA